MMVALVLLAGPATADVLSGDLNGDGVIDALDEPYLVAGYGASASAAGSAFEAAGDLDGSGTIDLRDLALFGAAWGASGGYVDEDEPSLFVTLNDLPDDMNDLVVVPPDLFQVTLSLSSAGGSAIDVSSLSVTSDEDLGVAQPIIIEAGEGG